jgi:hypothetical protein
MLGSLGRVLLAVCILLCACVLAAAYGRKEVPQPSSVFQEEAAWMRTWDPVELELGSTVLPEDDSKFPTDRDWNLMQRMSWSIYKFKTGWNDADAQQMYTWYFCGEKFQGKAARDLADTISYHIVRASWEASQGPKGTINPWGVLGTMAKESSFDLCALGLHPRKAAYKMQASNGKGVVLQPSKVSISHTYEEVVRAIHDKGMQKTFMVFDLGALQVLDRFYGGKPEFLLTWEGFYWQVKHMQERGYLRSTKSPWAYWPGQYSPKYDYEVVSYARHMGAYGSEIKPVGKSSF